MTKETMASIPVVADAAVQTPEPLPAPAVVVGAVLPTPESPIANGVSKEGPLASTPIPEVVNKAFELVITTPVAYVCKKHPTSTAFIGYEGTVFCSLCLVRFLRFHIKPATLKEAP